jgi:dTDP-4-dehydrorhamnose 3,5-epimerase-like enzyme
MKAKEKPFILESKTSADDRGVFIPWLSDADAMPFAGGRKVKRVYTVVNHAPGVIRGFHFHREEWKIFLIVAGAAKFVALDPEAPEDRHTFVSSSRKPNVVVIPPGYANGWVSLEANTILLCASTSSFEESVKDDDRMDPFRFGDVWTVKGR